MILQRRPGSLPVPFRGIGDILETDKPIYQQFLDEFFNPIGTDLHVLAQQTSPTSPAGQDISTIFSNVKWPLAAAVVGGLLVLVWVAKR